MEFSGIVEVNGAREAGSWPGKVNPALGQPGFLFEYGLRNTDASPESGGVIQGQIEAGDQPSVNIDGEGEDGAPDWLSGDLVNDDQIHSGVVDLHDVEWARGPVFIDRWREYGACRRRALASRYFGSRIKALDAKLDGAPSRLRQGEFMAARVDPLKK